MSTPYPPGIGHPSTAPGGSFTPAHPWSVPGTTGGGNSPGGPGPWETPPGGSGSDDDNGTDPNGGGTPSGGGSEGGPSDNWVTPNGAGPGWAPEPGAYEWEFQNPFEIVDCGYSGCRDANGALDASVFWAQVCQSAAHCDLMVYIDAHENEILGKLTLAPRGFPALLVPPRGALNAAQELAEELTDIAGRTGRRQPATVVGAESVRTGEAVAGRSVPGKTGCCAEVDAAGKLGGNPKDIRFTKPVRPRTGQIIPVCKNCQKIFDRSQFPPGTPFD